MIILSRKVAKMQRRKKQQEMVKIKKSFSRRDAELQRNKKLLIKDKNNTYARKNANPTDSGTGAQRDRVESAEFRVQSMK